MQDRGAGGKGVCQINRHGGFANSNDYKIIDILGCDYTQD